MSNMRLGVVAEFSDRASKRVRKFLRFNKQMEKINKAQTKQIKAQSTAQNKVARATENSARAMGGLRRLTAGVSSAAMGMSRGVVAFTGHIGTAIRRVNTLRKSLDLAARSRRLVRRGAGLARDGAGRLARGAVVAGGLAAGATATAAATANTVIGPAAQMEKYQTILETTTGSTAKAKEAMAWVTDFAVRTPYELQDVMGSFVQLRNYGLDPTNGLLKTLGDTSAAMGKPIMQAVEAMADAVTGENERLKEFGIKAKKAGKYFYYEYTQNGVTKVAKALASDRAAIQKTLSGIFDVKYSGAMEKLSRTWEGLVNNLNDMWFKFRLMIAGSGVFDWAKDKLKGFLDLLNQMEADGSLQILAETISANIITTLQAAWEFGQGLVSVFRMLGEWLAYAADMLGGWNRLAMVFVALPLISTIMSIIAGFAQLAAGIAFIVTGLAALSLPVLAIIAGVAALAAAAWLIYDNWDVVVQWFGESWDWIKDRAVAAWEWFKTNMSWHPLAIIANNWGKITEWFSTFWEGLKQLASLGWSAIKTLFRWTPLGFLITNWSKITEWFDTFFSNLGGKIKSGWGVIKSAFSFTWPELPDLKLPGFDTLKTTVIEFFSLNWLPEWKWPKIPMPKLPNIGKLISETAADASKAWNSLTSLFSDADPVAIAARDPASIERATAAANQLKSAMVGVASVDPSGSMSRLNEIRKAANGLPGVISGAIQQVNSTLAGVDFSYHGRRMMETIAAGMRARAHILVNEIRRVTQQIRDHLPSSPAKTGPLSDIHRLKFSETMAQSIRPGPLVRAMRKATAATLAAATIASPSLAASAPVAIKPSPAALSTTSATAAPTAQGNSGGKTIQISFNPRITIQGGGDDVRDQVMAALEDVLPELSRMIGQQTNEDERLDF